MNSGGLPLVTVGIPTYNRLTGLRRAVQSVLDQDYPNLELVISDNASQDGTPAYCEELRARDPRVLYLRHAANLGPCPNFSSALAAARGELFQWLADDDWLAPDYLSKCAAALGEDPSCAVAVGRVEYEVGGALDHAEPPWDFPQESPRERLLRYYRRVSENGIFYGLMRREALARAPFLNELGGDWGVVASVLWEGKGRAVADTCLHRSKGGTSRDMASLMRALSLPRAGHRFPYLRLCLNAYRQVLRCAPPSASSWPRRRWLALSCAAAVFRRFALGRARERLSALRRRLLPKETA